MNARKTAIVATILLVASAAMAQKQLTLENTVPGGYDFYEHHNHRARGLFVSNSDVFVRNETDGYHIGNITITRQQIDDALATSQKPSMSYVESWIDTETVWVYSSEAEAAYCINLKNNSVTDSITNIPPDATIDFAPDYHHAAVSIYPSLSVSGRSENRTIGNGGNGVVFGQSVHREEFGIEKGTFWSESGRLLAFYRMDESMVAEYPIVDITEREATAKPVRYPMAGETSHEVQICIYNTDNQNVTYLKTASPVNRYFTNIAWSPDDKFLLVAEINREQNHLWMNQYNADDGSLIKTIFEEENPEWVEPCTPAMFIDNSRFVWISERDGFKHLYLYDINTLKAKQLTHGNWCVTELYGFIAATGEVLFQANAEGYLTRDIYKVNLKGKMTRLSSGYGVHSARLGNAGTRYIDDYSAPDYAILSTLCNLADGKVIDTLRNVKNTYEGYTLPIFKTVSLKSADGRSDLCGRLILPADFDSTRTYPVIDYLYGGPHSQLVDASWLYGASTWKMYFAQQGYIIFTMDNRGTENRGVEYEHCIHRQLGKCEMEDQMVGINYLKSLPYVDTTRIGIHGWSFGGFMTINLMTTHNTVFKAGVAGGPVCDWRLYEVMYGERYMDTPQENPDGYAQNCVADKIGNLNGRLLVIHGDIDATVVWQNSLRLMQNAVTSDVMVDYAVYPQHEHNVIGHDRLHLFKRILRYFDDFLKP
ncbi:MAG: DPP IV N-terminal domain-containing protein [Salinivirgaceae bacterium]|nr:DPP IV N-terminal domain-containing protein [Salinivirgaceae bacterium]